MNTSTSVYFDDFGIVHQRTSSALQVLQTTDYYPFGLAVNSSSYQKQTSLDNDYLYNGKELQDDHDLGWADYGARMYMADIGRWGVIDPLTELSRRWNPYAYAYDNPIRYIDPDGMYAGESDPIKEKAEEFRQNSMATGDGRRSKEEDDGAKVDNEGNRVYASDIKASYKVTGITEYGTDVYVNGELVSHSVDGYNLTLRNTQYAGLGLDVPLALLSTASYAGGVFEELRASQIAKYTKDYLKEWQEIRNFNKGYKTARQATLAKNIVDNVKMLDGIKMGARRMVGVGLVLGVADMANNDFSAESVGWFAADTIMTGVAMTGWGAPVAGVYFAGRFVYGIYDLATKDSK